MCVGWGRLTQLTGHRRLLRAEDLEGESGCWLPVWKEEYFRGGVCAVSGGKASEVAERGISTRRQGLGGSVMGPACIPRVMGSHWILAQETHVIQSTFLRGPLNCFKESHCAGVRGEVGSF